MKFTVHLGPHRSLWDSVIAFVNILLGTKCPDRFLAMLMYEAC